MSEPENGPKNVLVAGSDNPQSTIRSPQSSTLDPQSSILRLPGVARAAESGFIVSAVGGNGPAIGRCGVFKPRIESAAANYFQPGAGERRCEFAAGVILEVARRPFPRVSAHIERAERAGAGGVASGLEEPALFPMPCVRVIRFPFVPPGVDAAVVPARGEFPFGFGRQTLFRPSRVSVRVAPRHVDDGKFRQAVGNLSSSPMRRRAALRGRNESLI